MRTMAGNTESTSFGVPGERGNVSTPSPVLPDAVPDSRPRTSANLSTTGPPNALFPGVAQPSTPDTPSQPPVAVPSFLNPSTADSSAPTSTSLYGLDSEHPIQAQARDVPKPQTTTPSRRTRYRVSGRLLSIPVLNDSLAAIGAFDDAVAASLPSIQPFSFDERAQIISEIIVRASSSRIPRHGASYGTANSGIGARGGNSSQVHRNPTAPVQRASAGYLQLPPGLLPNRPNQLSQTYNGYANPGPQGYVTHGRAAQLSHHELGIDNSGDSGRKAITGTATTNDRRKPQYIQKQSQPHFQLVGNNWRFDERGLFGRTHPSLPNERLPNNISSPNPEMRSNNMKRLEEESQSPKMDSHKKSKLDEEPTSKKVVENEDTWRQFFNLDGPDEGSPPPGPAS
ncbi:hypothetical protein V8F33_000857 [Rhypophila sp. PSN 637]